MRDWDDVDPHQVAADDELLNRFASVTWGSAPEREPEPAPPAPPGSPRAVADLLAALREDIDAGLAPAVRTGEAEVVPLRSRRLRRVAVTSGVCAAVLSISGVAAAGFSGTTSALAPLAPLHHAIWGPTDSEQAAAAVSRFLGLARADLADGRLRACDEALDHAELRLPNVRPADLGSLAADVAALRDALTAAYAVAAAGADRAAAAERVREAAGEAGSERGRSGSHRQHGKPSGRADGSGPDKGGSEGHGGKQGSDRGGSDDSDGSGRSGGSEGSEGSGGSDEDKAESSGSPDSKDRSGRG